MVVLGPSGSGKTLLLQDLITRMYKGCFERVYIFSPSCIIDKAWQPVHDMVAKMDYTEDEPPSFYEKWDEEALERILEMQTEIVKIAKERGMKSIPGIIICIDDFADRPEVLHASGANLVNSLFIRYRHSMVSCIVAVQKMKLLSPVCRVNAQSLIIFRLRSQMDLSAVVDELSAIYDKKTILSLYQKATEEPYSFLYVLLTAKSKENMFFERFEHRLVPK
jgi:GTPase SAR1 family protein